MRLLKAFSSNTLLINSAWLFFDKVYGAFLTLFIYTLLAKYFGTELFGIWNYMLAFAALLPAISSLGLNFVIVKNIKERPNLSNAILGNTFLTRMLAGVIATIVLVAVYYSLGVNIADKYLYVVLLLFISQILLNANVFIYKNEAELENRNTVIARNLALTFSSILRYAAIKLEMDILVFAGINIFEYALFLYLSWSFTKVKLTLKDVRLNKKLSIILSKQGMPLMLSAVVVILYLKIDQMIIAYLMDNDSVGIYSAASRISELFYALPVIISNVFFPKIVEFRKDVSKRNHILDQMHFNIILSTVLLAIGISVFSDRIILMLYGEAYIESGGILSVYAWSLCFMGLLVGSSKYLLVIGRNDIIFKRSIYGLVSNVILNFLLIPTYGILGAAYATLISYFIASYLSNIFYKELRPVMVDQFASLFKIPRKYFKQL